MAASNTPSSYGTVTKTFHWLTALLIITAIGLGVTANGLPYETNEQLAFKAQLFSLHKTIGITAFTVALARILWAVPQTKPGPLHGDRKVETKLAELVHWLLYVSLVAVPLTGWIHHAATSGFAPILLPIGQDLPFIPKSESIAELFAGLHWLFSKILVGSVLLHIVGGIKHQIIDKDATLRRMWFGNRDLPQVPAHGSSWAAPLAAIVIYAAATGAGAAMGLFSHEKTVEAVALDAVPSDWQVTQGEIGITVTQFGSPVSGAFNDWTAAISFDPQAQGTMGVVTTTIAIGSLELGSVSGQAMGADFFNVEAFPTAVFQADISAAPDTGYLATGTLTIKDNVVPVALPFTLTLDGDSAEMTGGIALDRRDFQIGQTMTDESNLGFGVTIDISLSATRAAE